MITLEPWHEALMTGARVVKPMDVLSEMIWLVVSRVLECASSKVVFMPLLKFC